MGGIACNLFCLDLDRLCGLYVCCGSGFDGKCPINAFTYFLYRLLFDLLIIGRFHRANQYPGINQYLLGVIGLNNFVFLFFALCLLQNMELEQNYKGLVTLLLRLLTSLFSFGSNGKGTFHFLDAYVIGYRSYVRIGDDPDPTGRDLYYLVLGFRGNDYSLVL